MNCILCTHCEIHLDNILQIYHIKTMQSRYAKTLELVVRGIDRIGISGGIAICNNQCQCFETHVNLSQPGVTQRKRQWRKETLPCVRTVAYDRRRKCYSNIFEPHTPITFEYIIVSHTFSCLRYD